MPNSIINKVADTCDMSKSKVEELWDKAKSVAQDQGRGENYGYIMGIFKKMIGKECKTKLAWESLNGPSGKVARKLLMFTESSRSELDYALKLDKNSDNKVFKKNDEVSVNDIEDQNGKTIISISKDSKTDTVTYDSDYFDSKVIDRMKLK